LKQYVGFTDTSAAALRELHALASPLFSDTGHLSFSIVARLAAP
jgi:hypothetical protein